MSQIKNNELKHLLNALDNQYSLITPLKSFGSKEAIEELKKHSYENARRARTMAFDDITLSNVAYDEITSKIDKQIKEILDIW